MSQPVDWIELRNGNFYCLPAECWLDPARPAKRAIITHAHGDHFPKFGGTVWASPETIAIAKARHGKLSARELIAVPWETPIQIGEVSLTLLPAGHILGSAQLLLEYQGQRVLFSGDFNLNPNPTCPPLSYPKVPIDLLICESTFGLKEVHPDPTEEMRRELERAGTKSIIIGAYSLGKAQRLTQLLTQLAPQKTIMVQNSMAVLHHVYQNRGWNLGEWQVYRKKEAKAVGNQLVLLVSPAVLTGYAADRTRHKLLATGWDKMAKFPWLDGQLEISDHASAEEIRTYIETIRPKEVWFWHGYPAQLAEHCKRLGIAYQLMDTSH